jgi:hypothetical protein
MCSINNESNVTAVCYGSSIMQADVAQTYMDLGGPTDQQQRTAFRAHFTEYF